jgi:predicted small secreted protein
MNARRLITGLALGAGGFLAAATAGCNTVEGIGEDLRSAGQATREAFVDGDDQPRTASTNDGVTPEKR